MPFKAFKPNQCRRAYKNKGFVENKKKDHCYYYLSVEGERTHIQTKVSHTNKKAIGKPSFSKMARDLSVSNQFLTEFIDCDKEYDDLIAELRSQGLI